MDEKPVDIRTVSQDEYWKVFEKRWTSLLSYRYIGRVDDELDADTSGVGSMALRHDMRNLVGGVMAAPLCIFSPEAGGMNDNRQVPNPVIQSLHILDDARGVKRVRSVRDTIRLGRQMGFSRSMIVDEDNPSRVISISEGMGVQIGMPPGDYQPVDNPHIQVEDSPDLPPAPPGLRRDPKPRRRVAPPRAQSRARVHPTRRCTSAPSTSSSRRPRPKPLQRPRAPTGYRSRAITACSWPAARLAPSAPTPRPLPATTARSASA